MTPPATWKPLPDVAAAAQKAAGAGGAQVTSAAAWGEPARGCFALAIAVHGSAKKPADLATELASGFAGEPQLAGIRVHDVTSDAASASLAFDRGVWHGKLRARAEEAAISAVACFWNDREPKACEAACAGMLK